MKKLVLVLLALVVSSAAFSKEPQLDKTLSDAASRIVAAIDGKMQTVALFDIKSDYWALSDYIVAGLNHELANKLSQTHLAERNESALAIIEKEQDFQLSGYVSDETALSLCNTLGADCILLGSVQAVDNGWLLLLHVSTVENKTVLVSFQSDVSSKERRVRFLIEKSQRPRSTPSALQAQLDSAAPEVRA